MNNELKLAAADPKLSLFRYTLLIRRRFRFCLTWLPKLEHDVERSCMHL